MNYLNIYNKIIEKSKSENRKRLKKTDENYVYYESHHIISKCIGGTNDKENLVLLTAREHYICHKLLTYIYVGNYKIIYAFFKMSRNKRYEKFSSKDYDYIKKLNSNIKKGKNNPMYGKPTSELQKESVRKAHKEGKIKLSEEGRMKIIETNKKRKGTKNSKKKSNIKRYELISPTGNEFVIFGAVNLQNFCKDNKLQFHVLKNNIGEITENNVSGNKLFAKNTIKWKRN